MDIYLESISNTDVENIDQSVMDMAGSGENMQVENVNEQEKRGTGGNDTNSNHPSTSNIPINISSSLLSGGNNSHGALGDKGTSKDGSVSDTVHSSSAQVEAVNNDKQQDEKSNGNEMMIISTASETKEPSSLDILRSRPEVIDVILFFWILLSHDDFVLSSHLLLTIDTFETSLEDPSSENGLLGALHSRLTTGKRKYDELKKKEELDTRSYDVWTSELIGLVNNWFVSLEKLERRLELSFSLLRSNDPRNKKGYNINNQETDDKGDEENDEKNNKEQTKDNEDSNEDNDMVIERSQTAATNASANASKSANDDFLTHEEIELLQMDIDMWKGILAPLGTKNPFADGRTYSSLSSIERLLILNALCEWHTFVVPDGRILECVRQFEVSALRSAPIGVDSFGNRYYHFPAFEFDNRIYEEAPTKFIPPIVVEIIDTKPVVDEKEENESSLNESKSDKKSKGKGESTKKSKESKDEKKDKNSESKKLIDESESKSTKKRDRDKEDRDDKNSKTAKKAKRDETKQNQDNKNKKEKSKENRDDGANEKDNDKDKNKNDDDNDDAESNDGSEASSQEKSKHKKSSKEKKKKKSKKKKEKKSKKKKHKHNKKKKSKKHSKHKHEHDENYESDDSESQSNDKSQNKNRKRKDVDESRNGFAENIDSEEDGQAIQTIAERRERRTNTKPVERYGEGKDKKKHKSKKKRSRKLDEDDDDDVIESDADDDSDESDGDAARNEIAKTEQPKKPRAGKKVKEEPPPESLFGMRHPLAPEMGKWRVCCNGIEETRSLIEKVRERNIPSEKDLISALDAALAFMMVERVMPTRNEQNLGIISAAVEVEDSKYKFLGQRLTRGANKHNEVKPPEILVKRSARLAIIESIKEEKERQEIEVKRREREMYDESIRIEAELLQQRKAEERRLRREQRQRERADQLQLQYDIATMNDDASDSVSTSGDG